MLDVHVDFYFNQEKDKFARESCQIVAFEAKTLRKLDITVSDKILFDFWRVLESKYEMPGLSTSCYRTSILLLSNEEGDDTGIKTFSNDNQRKYIDWYNRNVVNSAGSTLSMTFKCIWYMDRARREEFERGGYVCIEGFQKKDSGKRYFMIAEDEKE
jgi:hypothetical protein